MPRMLGIAMRTAIVKRGVAEPSHSRRPHPVDGYDESYSSEDRREASDENSHSGPDNIRIYKMRTERRCKRPARIHAASDHHIELKTAAYYEEIPACEIESGEGDVSCTNHERYKKIPQLCWCYWY